MVLRLLPAVAIMAGCIFGGEQATKSDQLAPELLPLASFAECHIDFPDQTPAPCKDTTRPMRATDSLPDTGWICQWQGENQDVTMRLYRNIITERYAFGYEATGRAPTSALLLIDNAPGQIWSSPNPGNSAILLLPPEATLGSGITVRLHNFTYKTAQPDLASATFEPRWTIYEGDPWVTLALLSSTAGYHFDVMSQISVEGHIIRHPADRTITGSDFEIQFYHEHMIGLQLTTNQLPGAC